MHNGPEISLAKVKQEVVAASSIEAGVEDLNSISSCPWRMHQKTLKIDFKSLLVLGHTAIQGLEIDFK